MPTKRPTPTRPSTASSSKGSGARPGAGGRGGKGASGHGGPVEPVIKTVARNRRARHDYEILDTYECGIALKGAEVKSLRAGQATLADAYARVDDGELWLLGAHFAPYDYATGYGRTGSP